MTDQLSDKSLFAAAARTPEHVVYRSFVTETVLLNLETGRYFGVNPSGGRMLEELVNAQTVEEAAQRLSEHYGRPRSEIDNDLQTFCADLTGRGLLELHSCGSV